jgi:hypothetical protein
MLTTFINSSVLINVTNRQQFMRHPVHLQNPILQFYTCLKLRNVTTSTKITLITQNFQQHSSHDIYIQFHNFHTRWQHYAEQERILTVQGAKSNFGTNGKNYSVMWTKVEFCGIQ